MHRYIIKRLLQLIPVVLGISFILFSIMNLTPGDPAQLILGDNATPEAVEQLREELGLNGNFFVRYFNYIKDALRGDFGISYRTKEAVFTEIFSRFPNTLRLATLAILLSSVFGVLFGILSAIKQYSLVDNATLAATLLITSMPSFWLGLMLIIVFSVRLGWFPISGSETWRHFVLPAIATSAGYMANIIRITRSTMLDVVRMDYIRTARAKGAMERTITFKHALRNALLPVVTVIGINMGWQLAGTIITEQVFAISGIGSLMIVSVRMKDTPVVIASVMFVALLASLINLGTDILYAYIDPRVKSDYVKG